MDSPYISTLQAAQALGVSVSTVKRWVDEGRLPAHKTAGGHRKLLRADVLALARQGELPHRDLTELFPNVGSRQNPEVEAWMQTLLRLLLAGEAAEVRGLIQRAYRSGMPVEILADEVIAPAMRQVGHEWEIARIDVWHEHRASQMCVAALHELVPQLARRALRNRPVALGAAPAGDPYQIPTLLAQLVLLDAGWNAVNLGPNTPFANLLKATRAMKPRLIWVSASHLENTTGFVRDYQAFYRAVQPLGVAVALGGRSLTNAVRSQLPYTSYGDRLAQLAAFARTLSPRAGTPRRGRPPKAIP